MARTQIKILIFLITVGLVAGTLSIAWWFYTNVLLKESRVEQDIAAMKDSDRPRIDPGARRFEAAVDLIKAGKINEGRDALYKLRQQFPESPTCVEAMRIIGEINLDSLFSPQDMSGKKDYIVQPGNTLLGIATKHNTTIDSIIRINGMMSTNLQPGDHLTLLPMDFYLGIMVGKKQVILFRKVGDKGYPFKFYAASDIRLPPGTRVPLEMEVAGKNASLDGRNLLPTDSHYALADKWISGTKAGIVIRTPPVPKPTAVQTAADLKTAKDRNTMASAPIPPPSAVAETGIFLPREDIEEIFALVRVKSKVSLAR